ncbi:MAG: M20/M25/M40 family metallo-hydrolase [Acidobacteriota bacterium]|nr:M20/M25/M40 family metallo-hydrolase [Acidobacteriota bacterium]
MIASTLPIAAQDGGGVKISTEAEIKEDIAANVCKNDERLEAVKKLFRKMGATDADIKVEKIKNVENVILTKKGKTEETVVVGAHYDKVSDGCGAIDNWTGIVVLANLYRTIKDFNTQKTFVFAAFGKEELGLLGSNEMAESIPVEKRGQYCAMVNFDSFGLTYPQAMTNISDSKLIELAKETSKEMKIPFADAGIEYASSDSASFRKQKIPAISLHGMTANWQDYLHTSRDKVENVNSRSVYIAYRYALNYLARIEAKGCADFRK